MTMTKTSRAQRVAFHEGTMYAAAEAYDAWRSDPANEAKLARAVETGKAEHAAKVDAYGERCEPCEGRGYVPGRWSEFGWIAHATCTKCRGRGKVLPYGFR